MRSRARSHNVLRVVRDDLERHVAVEAWRRLGGSPKLPVAIDVLKERHHNSGRLKAAVYRLCYDGHSGQTMIAKRCKTQVAKKESYIYSKVLPALSVPTLECLGLVEEEHPPYSWVFLEDAGRTRLSDESKDHRILRGTWLATVHSRASRAGAPFDLPSRDHGFYRQHLDASEAAIVDHLEENNPSRDDMTIFKGILALYDRLKKAWIQIEAGCERAEPTLVHGDFVSKNMCVVDRPEGTTLLAFDWQTAGWGSPAADLAAGFGKDDRDHFLAAYTDAARECGTAHDVEAIKELARIGKIFRTIMAISWDASRLAASWPETMAYRMRAHRSRLQLCLGLTASASMTDN